MELSDIISTAVTTVSAMENDGVESEESEESSDSEDDDGDLMDLSSADEDSEIDDDNMMGTATRNFLVKVGNYAEVTVTLQTLDQFREHFRLARPTFAVLHDKLIKYFTKDTFVGRPTLDLEKTMLISLWLLANHEPHRGVADRFGVSRSCTWETLFKFCNAVVKLNKDENVICWPTPARLQRIQRAFEGPNNTGFPGTVGCIDGCHIPICAPTGVHKTAYINRKGFHSVLLQGTCDSETIFTDVYIGEVGSIHDANMFKRSELYRKLTSGTSGLTVDQHILGDKAYPLSSFLLTPYRQTNQYNNQKKRFNYRLSKSRMSIERAFGLLKGRFRKLKYVEMRRQDLISLAIFTCCVLHNICMVNEDWEWLQNDAENEDEDDDDVDQATVDALGNAGVQKTQGEQKRTRIRAMFNR